MRIALVTETFPPEINGVAMTFGVIARELGRRGHAVTVYRPARDDLPPASSHPQFSEVAMPGMPLPGYPMMRLGFPAGATFRRWWRQGGVDLVHVVTEGPLGASAVSAARRIGIPVTSSFHTNFHSYTRHYGLRFLGGLPGRVALAWLRRVHNRTARTFAPTKELCTELATCGFRNLALLSRGVDTREFDPALRSEALRASWGAARGDPVIIHAGRMAAEKNWPLLMRACDAMRAANPRCRFVFVGDGPLRAGLERANPGCIFTGFLPREELARHYASADIYIHASLTETFGNVLTEAMASGLAVAGFDYAAARQFIVSGKNGLVVSCDAADALVDAAVWLAREESLRNRLRSEARRAVEAHSWERVITRFEADLHAVAGLAMQPETAGTATGAAPLRSATTEAP
ncbi:glycosyl transferase [Opitutaceae bacterium TAV5]|nr:glycosyl transferase [Opitutaceae bacterium TAV5]